MLQPYILYTVQTVLVTLQYDGTLYMITVPPRLKNTVIFFVLSLICVYAASIQCGIIYTQTTYLVNGKLTEHVGHALFVILMTTIRMCFHNISMLIVCTIGGFIRIYCMTSSTNMIYPVPVFALP
jgi:hypothetical protein